MDEKVKALTLLPLETPSHPYPCNPIQGHREAGVCPSMYWAESVNHMANTDKPTQVIHYQDNMNQRKPTEHVFDFSTRKIILE